MAHEETREAANLEDRVMELELRSEFQKKEILELDEVLREYALRVERLERELSALRAQLTALAPEEADLGDAARLES